MNHDWIKSVAPTVATALGGPLAGLAVEALAKAMGVEPDKVSERLENGRMTGEQIVQVRQAEIALKAKAQELGLNFEALAVDDRKSAREMQTSTQSWLVPAIALVIIGAFIAVAIGTLLGYAVIDSVLVGSLIGYLSAKAEQVVSFYFGSSNGSRAKDELLYMSKPASDK